MLITTDKYHKENNRNSISYKNIKVTNHALLRANDRLGKINQKDLKKLAANAKKNGIKINNLNENICSRYNISLEMYKRIKEMIPIKNNSTDIFLYKGYFYVFTGNHQNTLRSVIEMYEKYNKGVVVKSDAVELKNILNK